MCERSSLIPNKNNTVSPMEVFKSSLIFRFDLLIKLFYLKYRIEFSELANWAYLEHIRIFTNGTYAEPGSIKKEGPEVFLQTFENLNRDISAQTFDWFLSPIPINQDSICQNGAHRLSSAVFNDSKEIRSEYIDPKFMAKYDQIFFESRGLSIRIQQLSLLSLQLVNIPNLRVFIIWPTGHNDYRRTNLSIPKPLYRSKIRLHFSIFELLVRHIYGGEDWLGELSDTCRGSLFKAKQCFKPFQSLEMIVFLDDGSADRLKNSLRSRIGKGKHSVHCTDSYSESVRLLSIFALYPDLSPIRCQAGLGAAKMLMSLNGPASESESILIPGILDFDLARFERVAHILRNQQWKNSVRFFRMNGILHVSRTFCGLCILRNTKIFLTLSRSPEISNKTLLSVFMTVGDYVSYKIRMLFTLSSIKFWVRILLVRSVSMICNSSVYKWCKGRF